MEINNRREGSRVVEVVKSTILWFSLRAKLAEHFNVYPTALHAQYRLSTDAKGSLPVDLTSQQHLDSMVKMLRPLIVPPLLQNGKRSTRKMKAITVQVYNRDDEQSAVQGQSGSKVSCIHLRQANADEPA